MIAFAYYLLKMLICSGLLFAYYHVALRNKVFHQWNRFYLLAAIIISLAVPCLQFNVWSSPSNEGTDIKVLQAVYTADAFVAKAAEDTIELSMTQWITIGYSLVSMIILAFFMRVLLKIRSIIKSHPVMPIDDINFVDTEEKSAPFSFLNYVVWNRQIDLESTSGKQIFQHELAHVREKHSFDKLFTQAVLTIFWCNPFFWLIKRELTMIHEFMADQKSVAQSDVHAFAAMILHSAYPQHYSHLTNRFFHSSIKRRLAMLTKNNNPRLSYISRILALPLMAFLVLAFTLKEKKNEPTIKQANANSAVLSDTSIVAELKTIRLYSDQSVQLVYKDSIGNKLSVDDVKKIAEDVKEMGLLVKEAEIQTTSTQPDNEYVEVSIESAKIEIQDSVKPKPLILINGKEANDLKEVKLDKIESITVLKGESATGKYGEKAKDGAIEIKARTNDNGETIKEIRLDGANLLEHLNEPASGKTGLQNEIKQNRSDTTPDNKVYEKVDIEAAFPGGATAWRRYLERNLDPNAPVKQGAPDGTYTVVVQFIVNNDGSITDVKGLTKHGYGMEAEAVKAIRKGPKWNPAINKGKQVNAYRKQPITFVVQEKKKIKS